MLGTILSTVGSLAGGLFAQRKTDERQAQSQAFNAEQAQKQMDFQERMSGTAYQRAMKDMKSAGLNPILAYQKGPASSPTGAMASTSYHAANDVVTPAVASALQARRQSAELENMFATNKNLQEQNKNLQAERVRIGAQVGSISADTKMKIEALKQMGLEIEKRRSQLPRIQTDEKYDKSYVGTGMRYWRRFIEDLSGGWTGGKDEYGNTKSNVRIGR